MTSCAHTEEEVFDAVRRGLCRLVAFERVTLVLMDDEARRAVRMFSGGSRRSETEREECEPHASDWDWSLLSETADHKSVVREPADPAGHRGAKTVQFPIRGHDRLYGVLQVRFRDAQAVSPAVEQAISRVTNAVGQAVERFWLLKVAEIRRKQMAFLSEVRGLARGRDGSVLLSEEIAERLPCAMPLDRFAVTWIGPTGKSPAVIVRRDLCEIHRESTEQVKDVWATLSGRVAELGHGLLVSRRVTRELGDLIDDVCADDPDGTFQSGLSVPVFVSGVVAGVLHVRSKEEDAYSRVHLEILEQLACVLASAFPRRDPTTSSDDSEAIPWFAPTATSRDSNHDLVCGLSERDRKILQAAAQGFSLWELTTG